MKKKIITIIFIFVFPLACSARIETEYTATFKNASLQTCDEIFNKMSSGPIDMVSLDQLTYENMECWRRSMDNELNKRLVKLKKLNTNQFHTEMELQKIFNQATFNLCYRNCEFGDMKGIPYNSCRADAYKYRTAQAMQIDANQLSIPVLGNLLPKKITRDKKKYTSLYTTFARKLCEMPKDVWKGSNTPSDCEKNVLADLNSFDFTYDVCDLS